MRYFRYGGNRSTERAAQRERFKELSLEQRKIERRANLRDFFATVVFFTVWCATVSAAAIALSLIPSAENDLLFVLQIIGNVILVLGAIIVGLILAALVASPLYSKIFRTTLPTSRTVLHAACAHLRRFYGLCEPYVITKCFDSTDANFVGHDVCIFVVGKELRITANIVYGFADSDCDLGCYSFLCDELTLNKIDEDGQLSLELSAGDVSFRLGYRARGYIMRNLIL